MTARKYYPKVLDFEGQRVKMWRNKMEYLLKVMKTLYVLSTDCLEPYGDGPTGIYQSDWLKYDDFDCRNEILNHLGNSLYGVFSKFKIAKKLWEALIKE